MTEEAKARIIDQIVEQLELMTVYCPDCSSYGDDEQYTCTTCWGQGGDGVIRVYPLFKPLSECLDFKKLS